VSTTDRTQERERERLRSDGGEEEAGMRERDVIFLSVTLAQTISMKLLKDH